MKAKKKKKNKDPSCKSQMDGEEGEEVWKNRSCGAAISLLLSTPDWCLPAGPTLVFALINVVRGI
jgi:hypothetical protein